MTIKDLIQIFFRMDNLKEGIKKRPCFPRKVVHSKIASLNLINVSL